MRSLWERYLALLLGVPRKPQHVSHLAVGVGFTFRDGNGDLIATVYPDGTTVYQPDKIRSCGDAVVEHLAEMAAREAAEKEFGSTP